ncbi:hypothetical protein GGE08_001962 [Muricauda sp. ARW1Y1]|nr:hypothetical protein [Muricauda sp. ARW1Y1]
MNQKKRSLGSIILGSQHHLSGTYAVDDFGHGLQVSQNPR